MIAIIEFNPKVLNGKPVVKGTRIPVDLIFELLGANVPLDEILEDYPALTKDILRKLIEIGNSARLNLQNFQVENYIQQE